MTGGLIRRLAVIAVASAGALVLGGCEPMATKPVAASQQVEQLVSRCQQAMLREVCVAQKDRSSLLQRSAAPAASQVFVAGVGAIDAGAYNDIRAAGEAMCGMVRTRCSAGWDDNACKTARSLWPVASTAQRVPAG